MQGKNGSITGTLPPYFPGGNPRNAQNRCLLLFICTYLGFVAGFRALTTPDTENYLNYYLILLYGPQAAPEGSPTSFEFLFHAISIGLSSVDFPAELYLLFWGLLTQLSLYLLLKRYDPLVGLIAILIYVVLHYSGKDLSHMRAAVSSIAFLFAVVSYQRSLLKALFWTIISVGLHSNGVVSFAYILFRLLGDKVCRPIKWISIVFFCFIVDILTVDVFRLVNLDITRYSQGVGFEDKDYFLRMTLAYAVVLSFTAFVLRKSDKGLHLEIRNYVEFFVVVSILSAAFITEVYAFRVQSFIRVCEILLVARLFRAALSPQTHTKPYLQILIWIGMPLGLMAATYKAWL